MPKKTSSLVVLAQKKQPSEVSCGKCKLPLAANITFELSESKVEVSKLEKVGEMMDVIHYQVNQPFLLLSTQKYPAFFEQQTFGKGKADSNSSVKRPKPNVGEGPNESEFSVPKTIKSRSFSNIGTDTSSDNFSDVKKKKTSRHIYLSRQVE